MPDEQKPPTPPPPPPPRMPEPNPSYISELIRSDREPSRPLGGGGGAGKPLSK